MILPPALFWPFTRVEVPRIDISYEAETKRGQVFPSLWAKSAAKNPPARKQPSIVPGTRPAGHAPVRPVHRVAAAHFAHLALDIEAFFA
ncbi:MAG: hypothetical protein HQK81_11895 [Desulfovibrionaceae bacterium]|nr:hypothetical protein [Desulfovibrionaceae bacterium]MBF0514744.1 hypothetical protein [Desulfovibrionaceae bacterium]